VPPQRLTKEGWLLLIGEQDPFKLAVLGVAAIEAEFNEAIAEAFVGDVPKELERARFAIKLALVVGLDLLPARFKPLYARLATIRNRFAHGEIHTLTRQHSNALCDDIDAAFPETGKALTKQIRPRPPIATLRVALDIGWDVFAISWGVARSSREEDRQLAAIQRALQDPSARRAFLEDDGLTQDMRN
jgi:hypothetical protein